MLLMPLPGDENARVRFVVPKSVPCDVNGEPVNMLRFQEFPELVEGSGMYRFECSPTFLFGSYWVGADGVHYFRPEDPHTAKHVFVRLPGTAALTEESAAASAETATENAIDDQNGAELATETKTASGAAGEATASEAALRDYVEKQAIYRPNPARLGHFVMNLIYNEVEFNDMVDLGYHLEDFQEFCATQLRDLRERCYTRWVSYYGGAMPKVE